jgi:alkanesulfonate monooxygenase SsuD/methylene tetrahydromethanopterin reductase-like flavin-dependent oxidoreductase (luciferase family)
LKFGVFDHIDRSGASLEAQYADRLRAIEAFDAAGFDSYHVAEHHGTPLGMAPSPGIFLASVAQRTQRIRFGPLVYILPLYHPLRLAEEIAMLDRLSGGRFNLGIGRGISPIETSLRGRDPAESQARFDEVLAVLRLAFTEERVTYSGRYYQFADVPIVMRPIQLPHPPMWYGVFTVESAQRAAERGFNVITHSIGDAPVIAQAFRAAALRAGKPELQFGLGRMIVVAETDAQAMAIARRAFPHWYESFHFLYHAHHRSPVFGERPGLDGMLGLGQAIVGSPSTVLAALAAQVEACDAELQLGQFVFGDMRLAESLRSIELFAEHVMPALQTPSKAPR